MGREKREAITEVHTGANAFAGLCLAVVKHPSNILRVYCACEMWITIMFTISTGCTDSLKKKNTTGNGFTFGGTERSAAVAVIKNVN